MGRGRRRVVGKRKAKMSDNSVPSPPHYIQSPGLNISEFLSSTKQHKQQKLKERPLTGYFPVRRSSRKTTVTIQAERDKTIEDAILHMQEDGLQGRGVVTTRPFYKGEFVVEYSGDLIDMEEAQSRERHYMKDARVGSYIVDATEESGRMGRLINHSRNDFNLVPRTFSIGGKPHIIFLASQNIQPGEELLYDYGDRSKQSLLNHPWLTT